MNYETILNQKIQGIQPSGIRKFFDILEEMKDAISLGIGEPDFVTPWHIRDAGIYSLERGYTKYTSNAGMAELRREIASYLDRRFGLKYDYASQILVTVGGSEALDLSLRVLLNPGDEVIIPVPSFVCYGPLTEMAGGVPVYVELKAENQFRLTPEQLKAAITLDRRFGLKYDYASQILVTVGGSEALDLSLRVLLNPGDEVIIPVPSFVCYGPLTEMAGGVPVYVELKAENQFRLTPEQLKAAITPRTKALVLPFPSNPTGGIMERQDLEALAQVLRDTEIMVVSDEIYAELTYGQRHVSMANLEEMYDRTIVVNGFSKSHAMTGWRMGYVCAPKPIIQCLTKLHQFGIMSAPTVSQYAAIEAMRNGDRDIEHMREEYDSRRRYLVENLRRIGLSCFEPKGAFYVFPDIRSTGLTSNEFCERFLREERVAVIPGSAFGPGGEGFVRACYAASMKDISEAITRMDNFLTNLRRSQGRG